MINFAFFGTDEFSVGVLNALKKHGFLPSLIVTVPDKPKGRKMIMTPPPVKLWAAENGVKVIQPAKLSRSNLDINAGENPVYQELTGFDLFIVASYGKIIPQAILDLPKHGALNVHPSLLPKYRGASPLEYQILNGDEEVGVTIMLMDAEMDHGDIVQSQNLNIKDKNYGYEELRDLLAEKGGEILAEVMSKWVVGEIKATPQDHSRATYTKKIEKEDGLLNLDDDPILNDRKIRAFHNWPGTYFYITKDNKKIRVVIKKAHLQSTCQVDCSLIIERVVPEGKKEIAWEDFKRNL